MKLNQEQKDYLSDFLHQGGLQILESILEDQTETMGRTVLSLNMAGAHSKEELAARMFEYSGARKLAKSVLQSLQPKSTKKLS